MDRYSNLEIALIAAGCRNVFELIAVFAKVMSLQEMGVSLNQKFATKLFNKRFNYLTQTSKN